LVGGICGPALRASSDSKGPQTAPADSGTAGTGPDRAGGEAAAAAGLPRPESELAIRRARLNPPGRRAKWAIRRAVLVLQSHVYPGDQHTYWCTCRRQYDPSAPAKPMILQDGGLNEEMGSGTQNVMDNLIYGARCRGCSGGSSTRAAEPDQVRTRAETSWGEGTTIAASRHSRRKYARCSGRADAGAYKEYKFRSRNSRNPEVRSSGGPIAAFAGCGVGAFPNDFAGKVLSNVGIFGTLQGLCVSGFACSRCERRPIRVFLCDGRGTINRGLSGRWEARREARLVYQNVR